MAGITKEVEVIRVEGDPAIRFTTHDHDEAGECGPDFTDTRGGEVWIGLKGSASVTLTVEEARAFAALLTNAIDKADGPLIDQTERDFVKESQVNAEVAS